MIPSEPRRIAAGDICYVTQLLDKIGTNRKDRRCVVVLRTGDQVSVAAITSKFDENSLLPSQVRLPHGNPGSGIACVTSLSKPSVVDCQWTDVVPIEDVRDRIGNVPPKLMAAIVRLIEEIARAQKPVHATGTRRP